MDLELQGKVVWVTGASDGLGAATARRLAEEGAQLALCARGQERLEAVARELTQKGAAVLAVPTDVSKAAEVERFAHAALERFKVVDAIINNAGTAASLPFPELNDAAWQADLDLKLFGAIRLIRAALPHFPVSGGSILNMLAVGAKTPGARSAPSSVSRAAGMALTKTLSKELGPRSIRVNAVLIGLVESGQWQRKAAAEKRDVKELYAQMVKDFGVPLGRVARAEELADLAAFLVSRRSAYITGTAINFDGGLSPAV